MIRKEDCYLIGKFTKTHGVKGELVLVTENDFPEKYSEELFFVDIDGGLVPFFIDNGGLYQKGNASYRIKLEDVDTEQASLRFIGCSVYLPKEMLSDEEQEEVLGIEGFRIDVKGKGIIGEVERMDDYAGNVVMTVIIDGEDVLIPLAEGYLLNADYDNRIIYLDLPEGLIDLNN